MAYKQKVSLSFNILIFSMDGLNSHPFFVVNIKSHKHKNNRIIYLHLYIENGQRVSPIK